MNESSIKTALTLEKVTTRYIADEDRIRIDTQIKGGGELVLWLTRRMSNQITGAIVKVFEKHTVPVAPAEEKRNVQTFFQQEASIQRKKVPPVQVSPGQARELLVKQVNLQSNANLISLIFPLSPQEIASVSFKYLEARQWLMILQDQYRSGQWSMEVWPDWALQDYEQKTRQNTPPMH